MPATIFSIQDWVPLNWNWIRFHIRQRDFTFTKLMFPDQTQTALHHYHAFNLLDNLGTEVCICNKLDYLRY